MGTNAPINKIYNKIQYSTFRSRRAKISNVPVILKTGRAAVVTLSLSINNGQQYGYSHKRWFKKYMGIFVQCGQPA